MKVRSFHCGGEWTDYAFFDPQHPKAGTKVYIPYLAYLLEDDGRLVLVETGPNAQLVNNPATWIGDSAELYDVRVEESQLLFNQLHHLGIAATDITDVVLSHLHYDHSGSLTSFPNARIHVQRAEYDHAIGSDGEADAGSSDYVRSEFEGAVDWHLLDGDEDLFGDGWCTVIATPGHTPGHQSLLVRDESSATLFVGDAAPYPATLSTHTLPSVFWDANSEIASWKRIEDVAARHAATLVFPHDPRFQEVMSVKTREPQTE